MNRTESRTDPTAGGAARPRHPPAAEQCAPHDPDAARARGLRRLLREERRLEGLASIFKAMSTRLRLRILLAVREGETCVCDLAEAVDSEVSAVSHHLRLLRTMRLVTARRDGKRVYYSLTDDHVRALLDQGLEHVLR